MFSPDGKINENARILVRFAGGFMPMQYTTVKDEMLACREGAWLGVDLMWSPVYDVSGTDAVKLFNKVCVNRDYSTLKIGKSRHAIICDEQGRMMADGVIWRISETVYRTYWMAPVLAFYADTLGMDVQGNYVHDEFFIQIDGPRSLEIMEQASRCDIHDLKFAQNKVIRIADTDVTIHRLGMSGALAYEMHGDFSKVDDVYAAIAEAGKDKGLRQQGIAQYCRNHTQGGYPNQGITFWYPYMEDKALVDYLNQSDNWFFKTMTMGYPFAGSAADDKENGFATPYDVKWGYLVNFDHDFIGKEALQKIAKNQPNTVVTLEWNAEDIGAAYAAQFNGKEFDTRDDISLVGDGADNMFFTGVPMITISKVFADGKQIGRTHGRTHDFYHNRMISLAYIEKEYAVEGKELTVIWGNNPETQVEIRATVAQFPYFNEEYRNETFDVEKIPHPVFS